MQDEDLEKGLVCYWQIGGWHGSVIITKFNKKHVYYQHFANNKIENIVNHISLSKFLEQHSINKNQCEYSGFNDYIGEVLGKDFQLDASYKFMEC